MSLRQHSSITPTFHILGCVTSQNTSVFLGYVKKNSVEALRGKTGLTRMKWWQLSYILLCWIQFYYYLNLWFFYMYMINNFKIFLFVSNTREFFQYRCIGRSYSYTITWHVSAPVLRPAAQNIYSGFNPSGSEGLPRLPIVLLHSSNGVSERVAFSRSLLRVSFSVFPHPVATISAGNTFLFV